MENDCINLIIEVLGLIIGIISLMVTISAKIDTIFLTKRPERNEILKIVNIIVKNCKGEGLSTGNRAIDFLSKLNPSKDLIDSFEVEFCMTFLNTSNKLIDNLNFYVHSHQEFLSSIEELNFMSDKSKYLFKDIPEIYKFLKDFKGLMMSFYEYFLATKRRDEYNEELRNQKIDIETYTKFIKDLCDFYEDEKTIQNLNQNCLNFISSFEDYKKVEDIIYKKYIK